MKLFTFILLFFINLITFPALAALPSYIALALDFDNEMKGVSLVSENAIEWKISSPYPWALVAGYKDKNQVIAVGATNWDMAEGIIAGSSDGLNWRIITAFPYHLNAITWGENQYVAVGNQGEIVTSVDGENWLLQRSPTSHALKNIIWAQEKFIAIGEAGTLIVSSNGVEWELIPPLSTASLSSIVWNNNQFVVLGKSNSEEEKNIILSSKDGFHWETHPQPQGLQLNSVTWDGNQFIGVDNNGVIANSNDGILWNSVFFSRTNSFRNITWHTPYFLAGGYGEDTKTPLLISKNGMTWDKVQLTKNYIGIEAIL